MQKDSSKKCKKDSSKKKYRTEKADGLSKDTIINDIGTDTIISKRGTPKNETSDTDTASTSGGKILINSSRADRSNIVSKADTSRDIFFINKHADSNITDNKTIDDNVCLANIANDTVIINKSLAETTFIKEPTTNKGKDATHPTTNPPPPPSDETTVINVAGELFETYTSTLNRFPQTLLGSETTRQMFRNQDGELFFNRSIDAFEAILYYYQSKGTVYYPELLPLDRFIDEIVFFKLGDEVIEQLEIEQGIKESNVMDLPDILILQDVWKVLEYPESNRAARMFAFSSLAVILLSTIIFIVESFPQFSAPTLIYNNITKTINATISSRNTSSPSLSTLLSFTNTSMSSLNTTISNEVDVTVIRNRHSDWLFPLNTAIIIWFTSEFLLRFIACPDKLHFWISFGNLVDLFVVLPYYIEKFLEQSGSGRALGFVRAIRVFRVLKLSRHSAGMQLVGRTIAATYRDLFMTGFLMFILALLYSSVVYYAEYQTPDSVFISIPHTAWWSIVTLTTVGYGDMAPTTVVGKLVGAMTLLSGCLMLSLPLPAVVSNFTYFLNVEKLRKQVQDQKRKVEVEEVKVRDNDEGAGAGGGLLNYVQEVTGRVTRLLLQKSQRPPQPPPTPPLRTQMHSQSLQNLSSI